MPAPSSESLSFHRSTDARSLNHVNLMVDSFIANARVEDLRATVRILLATMPPSTAQAFTKAARSRLSSSNASPLPHPQVLFYFDGTDASPTSGLYDVLAHARALYGAGMGLTSFGIFTTIIRNSLGLRWTPFGTVIDAFTLIDGDICQALQSAKEEIDSGRAGDLDSTRAKVADLRAALKECADAIARWGGNFPFERAAATLEVWKI
ncbi:hypothetical protein B0F90DRAFT_1752870 [Multifurca ochricompacta]|uniref:Uncharacterized protein n=1 Tax=Multifurca ochricompacta TaxID=376703 RepID=A0AAD4LYA0_9AGAM|nr:hypothetical protein B0F90DRAFT_1752870 [Multifurca ochricompacta]